MTQHTNCPQCGVPLICPVCSAKLDYEERGKLHLLKCANERCRSDAAHNGGSGSSPMEAFRNMLASILSELKASETNGGTNANE